MVGVDVKITCHISRTQNVWEVIGIVSTQRQKKTEHYQGGSFTELWSDCEHFGIISSWSILQVWDSSFIYVKIEFLLFCFLPQILYF